MRTPNLLKVPKDSPTRKERIESFKKEFDIETHYCKAFEDEHFPWMACKMDIAKRIRQPYRTSQSESLGAIMADVCRLLEESGVVAEGNTEAESIRQLCANLDMICTI